MSIDHYSSAKEMLEALRQKDISAVELTDMHISRIEALDGDINAIPVRTFERARESADAADKAISRGESAALLGLPMTLKESTQVAGLPQTAGLVDFKGYAPQFDGTLASKTFAAGPCLLGKTNIPVALADWQADSPVYGRTCNPWDLERSPGGSTGGGGAALAAGMTPLELGSDIGGSIRAPAAFCGVYGHRPTETAIPRSGSFPMADLPNDLFFMGVQGPLARTAGDLELYFDVLAGPDVGEDAGWKLDLPPSRADTLRGFRVAVLNVLSSPGGVIPEIRPSTQMSARVEELASFLSKKGARVSEAVLPFDILEYFKDYTMALTVLTNQATPKAELEAQANQLRAVGDPVLQPQIDGLTMSAPEYVMLGNRRSFYQAQWREFFKDIDVIVAPMMMDSALPHQTADREMRTLTVDNTELPYFLNIAFPMIAIYTGLPATAFPGGLDSQGLPLGIQAIGPYLEDRTTLRFAGLLEEAWQNFLPPPDYP